MTHLSIEFENMSVDRTNIEMQQKDAVVETYIYLKHRSSKNMYIETVGKV